MTTDVISLRSGRLLSLSESSDLARTSATTLVTLVGPPKAGKSTLLATIHECFRQNRFQSLTFSGSRTLVAFEEICHLSRIASGLRDPDTERSKFSDEEFFYHLTVNRAGEQSSPRSLFLMDVAGDGFDDLRKSHENCLAITSLKRTEFLTLMIDGDKLHIAKERYAAIEDAINFLKCVWDGDAVKSECKLHVIVTKVDKLQEVAARKIIAEMWPEIQRRLEHRFTNRSFFEIAARPENGCNIPPAHGVEALLGTWLVPPSNPPIETATPATVPDERESEAFLRRHFTTDSQ
jgi:GTP-binding protein EngB required for normal cell division